MADWVQQCQRELSRCARLVIVSVASIKGSTPREPGARMLVSAARVIDTIGGGNLEYQAIRIARNMLERETPNAVQRFSLAAGLGQCCGGVVTLFFETVDASSAWLADVSALQQQQTPCVQAIPLHHDACAARLLITAETVLPAPTQASAHLLQAARDCLQQQRASHTVQWRNRQGEVESYWLDPVYPHQRLAYLFGAGHVGRALAPLLGAQVDRLYWVDTRDDIFPSQTADNIECMVTDTPQSLIEGAAPGGSFIVMTHDHQLDFSLTQCVLQKADFSYFGLIGSKTKRARFEHRLLRRGVNREALKKMVCPVGIAGIKSKLPAAIAVSVMAQWLLMNQQTSELPGVLSQRVE